MHIFACRCRVNGFSLLEVVVSLFVLSVGFLGVIQLATATLRNSMMERDAVTASLLVQEGIELVYNIRDTNVAKGQNAFLGIDAGSSYRIDPTNPLLVGSTSDQLVLKLSGGLYEHGGSGSATKFSREIIVSGNTDTRTVTSVVVWGGSSFPGTVSESTCSLSDHCSFTTTLLQESN